MRIKCMPLGLESRMCSAVDSYMAAWSAGHSAGTARTGRAVTSAAGGAECMRSVDSGTPRGPNVCVSMFIVYFNELTMSMEHSARRPRCRSPRKHTRFSFDRGIFGSRRAPVRADRRGMPRATQHHTAQARGRGRGGRWGSPSVLVVGASIFRNVPDPARPAPPSPSGDESAQSQRDADPDDGQRSAHTRQRVPGGRIHAQERRHA